MNGRVSHWTSAAAALGAAVVGMLALVVPGEAAAPQAPVNDYPTAARADYVFACLQVNGQNRDNLLKCSCSIDVIAEILPYAEYEEAETIMSVIQRGGENVSVLRAPMLQEKVTNLKRAQVEGELRCF
ncbi:MAG: hypothetical protein AB7E80_10565 [Hyphomicrobiaceae bacterium]